MRKTSFLLVVVSAIILFPVKALATQWVRVISTDEFVIHIDVDSIKAEGNRRKFWQRTIYPNGRQTDGGTLNMLNSLFSVDCPPKTFNVTRVIGYDAAGSVIFDSNKMLSPFANFDSNEVVLGTLGDSIGELVCNRKSDSSYSGDVSLSSGLSRQQAVNLVNRWLKGKRQIFSSPFNQSILSELTTGKLYDDSINSINWLRNNNARYEYGFQEIESVEAFSSSSTQAVLEVRVTEDATLFINGRMDSKSSKLKTQTIKYNLQFVNGVWKIGDY